MVFQLIGHTTENQASQEIWDSLLIQNEFKEEIYKQGYSNERIFTEYLSMYGLTSKFKKYGAITATNLSIDLFSRQNSKLRQLGYYVIRTGRGKFIIFDENRFPRPYLNLNVASAIEVKFAIPKGFNHLYEAFKSNMIENSAIEQLRFIGIFQQIVFEILSEKEYYIGPRGNRTSEFDVYFRRNDGEIIKVFTYKGQEELDYSIFTRNGIILIEAKNYQNSRAGLDIGWHKIAYPINRFKQYQDQYKLIPCYLLKNVNIVHLFVFPRISLYNEGVILNKAEDFQPIKILKINLSKYYQ